MPFDTMVCYVGYCDVCGEYVTTKRTVIEDGRYDGSSSDPKYDDPAAVRREAGRKGWVRRGDQLYCPAHAPKAEAPDRTGCPGEGFGLGLGLGFVHVPPAPADPTTVGLAGELGRDHAPWTHTILLC